MAGRASRFVVAFLSLNALTLLWTRHRNYRHGVTSGAGGRYPAVAPVSGLRDVHQIRTRSMGGKTLMDLHLQVDPVCLCLRVTRRLLVAASVRAEFDDIIDITFHIDPENDADIDQEGPSSLRPPRR